MNPSASSLFANRNLLKHSRGLCLDSRFNGIRVAGAMALRGDLRKLFKTVDVP